MSLPAIGQLYKHLETLFSQPEKSTQAYHIARVWLTALRRSQGLVVKEESESFIAWLNSLLKLKHAEAVSELLRQLKLVCEPAAAIYELEGDMLGLTTYVPLPEVALPSLKQEQCEKQLNNYLMAYRLEATQELQSKIDSLDNLVFLLTQERPVAVWDTLSRLRQGTQASTELRHVLQQLEIYGLALLQAEQRTAALSWFGQLYLECEKQASFYAERALENLLIACGIKPYTFATPRWRLYREQLIAIRGAFSPDTYSQSLLAWLRARWDEVVAHAGVAPDSSCLLGLGSISRDAMALYSDIECALLVNDSALGDWESKVPHTERDKLKTAWWLFEWLIRTLGEPNGLHIDPNSQPRTEPDLRTTPQLMAKRCIAEEQDSDDGLIYSLLHPCYLAGSKRLFEDYQQALHTVCVSSCQRPDMAALQPLAWRQSQLAMSWHRYWALSQLQRNRAVYQELTLPALDSSIDIKKPYYKLLTFLILDVALYHNLPATNPWQAANALQGVLPISFCQALARYLTLLQTTRNQAHQQAGEQNDEVVVDTALLATLKALHRQIFKPFYGSLGALFAQGWPVFRQQLWLHSLCQFDLAANHAQGPSLQIVADLSATSYALPDSITQALFPNGELKRPHGQLNSIVVSSAHYTFKLPLAVGKTPIAPTEGLCHFIATEEAVSRLSQLLGDEVVPAGCAVKLSYQGNDYYGWLCEHIDGNTLERAEQAPQQFTKIAPESYAALFALSLLVYPEDGQPRNFKLLPHGEQLRLVSIDNKRAFVNPLRTLSKLASLFGNPNPLNIKTMLYLMPQIKQALPSAWQARLQQMDVKVLASQWQATLSAMDTLYYNVLHTDAAPPLTYGFNALELEKITTEWLPLRLEQLQNALTKAATYADLLKTLEPELAAHYTQLRMQQKPFIELFRKDYTVDNQARIFSTSTQSLLKQQRIQLAEMRKRLLSALPDFFATLDFSQASSEQQTYWLSLMEGHGFSGELSFKGCRVLTDDKLTAILRNSSELTALDVSDCPLLTTQSIKLIERYAKSLQRLYLDGNTHLTEIKWNGTFKQLETLSVRHCPKLRRIAIRNMPQHKYLYTEGTAADIMGAEHYALYHAQRGFIADIASVEVYALYHAQRGLIKDELGDYTAAIADYDEAIRLKPDNTFYFAYRGNSKAKLGDYAAAIADYDEAIRLKPDKAAYFDNRANSKAKLGDYATAIADYDEAIRLKPDGAACFNNRGNSRYNLGDYVAAIADYDEAIRLKPDNAVYFYNRGDSRNHLGDYVAAIADYDEAIRLKPDNANYFHNRGWCYLNLAFGYKTAQQAEFLHAAQKDFDSAAQQDHSPVYQASSAFICVLQGQSIEARQKYATILAESTEHEALSRAKIYALLGLSLINFLSYGHWDPYGCHQAWLSLEGDKLFICQQLTLFLLAIAPQNITGWAEACADVLELIAQTQAISSSPQLEHYTHCLTAVSQNQALPYLEASLLPTDNDYASPRVVSPSRAAFSLFGSQTSQQPVEDTEDTKQAELEMEVKLQP